ncbi:MAG: transcriptional repressor [Deltaproteobacteria bacterium]|jgi:Fur family transcriptional regulator, ferric uptake regulator|nr:transcriptional repressor [Deltaproteobacteria bacterium]
MQIHTRMTKQKRVIVEELAGMRTHPTANEVYQLVRSRLPKISLATVYRNLEQLSEDGSIRRIDICGSQRRFDPIVEPHHHMRCNICKSVYDLPVQKLEELEGCMGKCGEYTLTGYNLAFCGVCHRCDK